MFTFMTDYKNSYSAILLEEAKRHDPTSNDKIVG